MITTQSPPLFYGLWLEQLTLEQHGLICVGPLYRFLFSAVNTAVGHDLRLAESACRTLDMRNCGYRGLNISYMWMLYFTDGAPAPALLKSQLHFLLSSELYGSRTIFYYPISWYPAWLFSHWSRLRSSVWGIWRREGEKNWNLQCLLFPFLLTLSPVKGDIKVGRQLYLYHFLFTCNFPEILQVLIYNLRNARSSSLKWLFLY